MNFTQPFFIWQTCDQSHEVLTFACPASVMNEYAKQGINWLLPMSLSGQKASWHPLWQKYMVPLTTQPCHPDWRIMCYWGEIALFIQHLDYHCSTESPKKGQATHFLTMMGNLRGSDWKLYLLRDVKFYQAEGSVRKPIQRCEVCATVPQGTIH